MKKNLLEFLMIFFAIIAGFFVDNYREHRKELAEEKELMRSMLLDLEKDREVLVNNQEFGKVTIRGNDSLSLILRSNQAKGRDRQAYHYFILFQTGISIPYHDRTISQLKNSGKFTLVNSKELSNAIIDYDRLVTDVKNYNEGDWNMNIALMNFQNSSKIFDFSKVYQYKKMTMSHKEDWSKVGYSESLILLSYDRNDIQQLLNSMAMGRNVDANVLIRNDDILQMNKRLDSLIRALYD